MSKNTGRDGGLMHIDGEPITAEKELNLKCVSGGLSVFASSV